MSTWKERAVEKYRAQQEEYRLAAEKREAERQEKLRVWLKDALLRLGIEAEPESGSVVVDGVIFEVVEERYTHSLRASIEKCPECGHGLWSYPITPGDVTELGGFLENHRTVHHSCPDLDSESESAEAEG